MIYAVLRLLLLLLFYINQSNPNNKIPNFWHGNSFKLK